MGALHLPNIGGELDADIGDNAGGLDLTLSSPALAAVGAIASPDYIWICVDPDGIHGAPEWMKVTALVAGGTSGTVTRGEQGSTARAHKAGVEWVHTLAPSEIDDFASVIPAVEETTTARTLIITDAGKVVECTNAAATTVTIPPEVDVAWTAGTIVNVYAAGAGGVTIAAGIGVTIRNMGNLTQYAEASFRYRGGDEWVQAA